ncbi:hypothetical protein BD769DRAFT_1043628 [Suillus cothurnatus]|nr:hypothetical protein BD769DRAFT_1043628 [Suillus cothurnatus]
MFPMCHQYLGLSMATFWTYDYACSLHEEWTFLLRSRWNKVKCLYIIARNAPFVIFITDLYMRFSPTEDTKKCLMLINIYTIFGFISAVCSESIFVLRTYVLWNNSKFILVATVGTAIVFAIVSIEVAFTTVSASHVMTSVIPGITGCYRTSRGIKLSMPFLFLFAFELGLVSLTLIRAMQEWRAVNGPLYNILVKHNIFYYACGLLLATGNVLMPMLFSQHAYHSVFENFSFYILSILATRMHLSLWHLGQDHHVRCNDGLMLNPIPDMSLHHSDVLVVAPNPDVPNPDAPTADQMV